MAYQYRVMQMLTDSIGLALVISFMVLGTIGALVIVIDKDKVDK